MKLVGQHGRFRAELEYDIVMQNGTWFADCAIRVYMNDKPTLIPPCYPRINHDRSVLYCDPPERNRACNGYRYLVKLDRRDDPELEQKAVRILVRWLADIVFVFEEGYTVLEDDWCSTLAELCECLENKFTTWLEHFEKAREVINEWSKLA